MATALETVFMFLVPLVIRLTIDSVIGDKPLTGPALFTRLLGDLADGSKMIHYLWLLGGLIVLLTILQGLFTYLKGRWSAEASERIVRNLRDRLYDHLQRLPFSYHARAETGDLIQRCTSDVETTRRFLSVQVVEMGRAVFMLVFLVPIMLSLDLRMSLVALASVPVLLGFAFIFFLKVKAAFQLSDEAEGQLSTVLQENLTGARVVRAFTRQEFEKEKFEKKNSQFRDLTYRLIILLAGYWSVSDFLVMAQVGALLVCGTWWAANGSLTLGTLVVFITYEWMLLFPIRQMGRILTDLGKTFVSLGRIGEILDVEIEKAAPLKTIRSQSRFLGEVVFRNVCFGYHPGVPVLNDITFRVEPGQTVAILGPTGSGKTTLVNLLPRLYEYTSGSLTIDGRELKSLDRSYIRGQIGIVLQEPFLFSKTVGENISLGSREAMEKEIREAAAVAVIDDVIMGFEEDYNTIIGERGVNLSGGQVQRMAIARAILKDPAILILDDALSAVDTETEAKILSALQQRKGRATTFVIAHRLTTVQQADLIIVLDQGKIAQMGTHEQLCAEEGIYRRIKDIQQLLE
jgi:ATP-binding cassette subfamily B protein